MKPAPRRVPPPPDLGQVVQAADRFLACPRATVNEDCHLRGVASVWWKPTGARGVPFWLRVRTVRPQDAERLRVLYRDAGYRCWVQPGGGGTDLMIKP